MRLVPERNPLPRLLAFVYLGVALLVALAFEFWGPVIEHTAFCPLRRSVGLPCPTCGGTHAALALVRLEPIAAFRLNPLITLAALLLVLWVGLAGLATLVPAWRREILLTAAGRRLLRWGVVLSVLGTWIYEILRLS
jgi:hypothetical protein